MPKPWLAERRPVELVARSVRGKRHAERVVEGMADNFAGITSAEAREYVARREDPSKWPDALLVPLGQTRKEAVELAREVRRVLAPAYAVVAATANAGPSLPPRAAPRRTRARVRGAGRPAARRTRSAASSSAGSGDDGSGSADPEPASNCRPVPRADSSSCGDASTWEMGR